jgi:phosphoadenosine phosphosulfate reductase
MANYSTSTQLDTDFENLEPQEIIRRALESFTDIAISFSGAEDVVLIDMAVKIDPQVKIFSLDTGRLHAQTYRYIERVRTHYGIAVEILFPEPEPIQAMVREKGLFSFFTEGHQQCCSLRKVAPLRRKLGTLEAWITGQRRDQSPGTRAAIPVVQKDLAFSTHDHSLIKFNPLVYWSSAEVWDYIREHQVPYNPLHEQGYISIGCEPCTRPVLPNQHEREGRWWWEELTQKECGLHAINSSEKG